MISINDSPPQSWAVFATPGLSVDIFFLFFSLIALNNAGCGMEDRL